jgi:citrate lyase synthetase
MTTPIKPMTVSAEFLTASVRKLIKDKDLEALCKILPELTFKDASLLATNQAEFQEHEGGFIMVPIVPQI